MYFFFFQQKTAYEVRISDWSSDVCSSDLLGRLYPDASEALQLAVRAQHIRRWTVPRASYPMDRPGYLRWRNDLKRKHAEWASTILADCDYARSEESRVGKECGSTCRSRWSPDH